LILSAVARSACLESAAVIEPANENANAHEPHRHGRDRLARSLCTRNVSIPDIGESKASITLVWIADVVDAGVRVFLY
jgi:hypothetical protein